MAEGIKVVLDLDDKLTLAIRNAQNELQKFVAAGSQAAASARALEKNATSLSSKFRDLVLVGGMLRFVAYDIRDIFNATAGATIKASSEIQRMTKVMEGLSDATDEQARRQEALSNREFVFKLSKNAPFEVNALTDSFIKFKSAGLDPTNGSMQSLVDSVARYGGSSEQLKRASIAIQQMAGKGVVSMEELRQQLGEAVPSAMALMARGMGMNMAELAKAVKTGTVEATNAIDRMTYQMKLANSGAAEAMMQTWQGQFEKLKTNMSLFLNDIGTMGAQAGASEGDPAKDSFMGKLSQGLMEFNKFLESSDGKKLAADLAIIMSDLASAMVEVARAATTAARVIIENWDTVVRLLGTLTTLYFADKMITQFKKMGASYNEYKSQILGSAKGSELAGLQEIAFERQKTIEIEKELIKRSIAQRREAQAQIAAAKAAQARLLADYEGYEQREAYIQDRYNRAKTDRTRKKWLMHMEATRNAMSATNVSISQAEAKEKQYRDVIVASTGSIQESRNRIREAANNAGNAVVAMGTRMASAGRIAGAAFNAILGPLSYVLTALSIGAAAWEMWGKNATESLNDVIRKVNEYATAENLQMLKKQSGVTRQGADELGAAVKGYETNGSADSALALRRALRTNSDVNLIQLSNMSDTAVLDRAKQRLNEMNEQLKKAGAASIKGTKEVFDRAVDDNVSSYEKSINKLFEQYDGALSRAQKAQMDANPNQSVQELNKWQRQTATAYIGAKLKVIDAEEKKIDEKLKKEKEGTVKYAELLRDKTLLAEKANELNRELIDQVNKIGNQKYNTTPDSGLAGAKVGEAQYDKLQQFINKIKDKNVELQDEIAGITDSVAVFYQKLERGDFDTIERDAKGKVKNIIRAKDNPQKVQEAVDRLREEDEFNKRLSSRKKALSEFQSSLEQMSAKGADISERYTAAISNFGTSSKTYSTEIAKFDADVEEATRNIVRGLEERRQASIDAYNASSTADNAALVVSEEDVARATKAVVEYFKQRRAEMTAMQNMKFAETLREQAQALEDATNPDKRQVRANKASTEIAEIERRYQREVELANGNAKQIELITRAKNRAIIAIEKNLELENRTSFEVMLDDWQNTVKQMSDSFENWANGAVDVMVNFVKTGKLEFSSLVDSILTDILRMQIKAAAASLYKNIFGGNDDGYIPGGVPVLDESEGFGGGFFSKITNGIKDFFSFANGGIMTGTGPVELRKYAMGGIANRPQLALYGEGSMNEAFVPLPDGRTIPVTMTGGGGASANVIVNVINNAAGTQAREERTQNGDGSMNIDVIIESVEQKLSQSVSKGRGSLSSTLEKTYGLNRAAGAY